MIPNGRTLRGTHSEERVARFVAAAEDDLRKVGGETAAGRREIERDGRRVAGLKQKEAPSRELVEDAVAHIPNDDLSYDEWVRVGLALYASLGSEARDLWEAWSAEAEKNDPCLSGCYPHPLNVGWVHSPE